MGERKGVNKYYPPDWTPDQGGLDKYHGTHPLRERARLLHEGILIIRFEMPYNIWCNGCGNHIGMGVRYNAQKRKVGNYYTTPIYKFRMKCHLCDQYIEIQTDPKNSEYVILSGAKRKEERWDPAVTENVQTTDYDVKQKLIKDAMYKLEHSIQDEQKAKKVAPTLNRLEEIRDKWSDDFAVNQLLRKKFRHEKKEINEKKIKDDDLKERASLPADMQLVEEDDDDLKLAKKIKYGGGNVRPDQVRRKRRHEIKHGSIFKGGSDNAKNELAKKLARSSRKSKAGTATNDESVWTSSISKNLNSLVVISKMNKSISNEKRNDVESEELKGREDNEFVSSDYQNIRIVATKSIPDKKEDVTLSNRNSKPVNLKEPASSVDASKSTYFETEDNLGTHSSLVACYSDSSNTSSGSDT